MQVLIARGLLIALGTLGGACLETGNLGYTFEPRCEGKQTRCRAPKEYALVDSTSAGFVSTGNLATLSPLWSMPLDCGGMPLVGGAGSSVWVFCLGGERTELLARQFDASGSLGDARVAAPTGLVGDSGTPTFFFFSKTSTPEGPIVGLEWSVRCTRPDEHFCVRHELIRFTNDVKVPPTRLALSTNAPAAAFDVSVTLPDAKGGYYLFARPGLDWSAARLDALGNVTWLQQAFPPDFVPGLMGYRGPATFTNGTLSVLGTRDTGELALVDLDGETGNMTARQVGLGDPKAKIHHDSLGRLVLAHADGVGNLQWTRFEQDGPQHVMLYRSDFTLLSAIDLDVDAQGASYLLTATGSLEASSATLCRMNDARQVSCALLPEAFSFDVPGLNGGAATVHEFASAAVSGDGSVYTVSKDASSLVRYRFPELATP